MNKSDLRNNYRILSNNYKFKIQVYCKRDSILANLIYANGAIVTDRWVDIDLWGLPDKSRHPSTKTFDTKKEAAAYIDKLIDKKLKRNDNWKIDGSSGQDEEDHSV